MRTNGEPVARALTASGSCRRLPCPNGERSTANGPGMTRLMAGRGICLHHALSMRDGSSKVTCSAASNWIDHVVEGTIAGSSSATIASDSGRALGCCCGIGLVKKSAITAISTSSASAARSPSRRACSFTSRTACVVAASSPACCSADSSWASETNGIPAASSTLACRDSSLGTAGFCAIPVRNEAVSAAIEDRAGKRGAERGAELRRRVLKAAHLGTLFVGDRRDGDAPELRGQAAHAQPDQQQRNGHDLGAGTHVHGADSTSKPTITASRLASTTRRGEAAGRTWVHRPRRAAS